MEEPVRIDRCDNIGDFRLMARRRLPGPIFHYIDGAADDEVTYRRNTEAYERCDLVPNVLAGVESIDMSITVWQKIDMPLFCAPTALQRLFHHDGERGGRQGCREVRHHVRHFVPRDDKHRGDRLYDQHAETLPIVLPQRQRPNQQHDRAVHRRKFRRAGADRRYDHGWKPGTRLADRLHLAPALDAQKPPQLRHAPEVDGRLFHAREVRAAPTEGLRERGFEHLG